MPNEEVASWSWSSYPSIYALGHKAIEELLLDDVTVEEKIDGSQFSFGRFNGVLKCRSKGAQLNIIAPEGMFKAGVDAVGRLDLKDGWTYRGEYLQRPKHNTLAYERAPKNHVILFDINPAQEAYLSYEEKKAEADRIGLEIVPLIFKGRITDLSFFRRALQTESCLGGQPIEGVVVKNYARFGRDKKVLMGKFVSEAFKESHGQAWRESNPTQGDVLGVLCAKYTSSVRWSKAVQHLKEAGALQGAPRDIPALFAEVKADIEKECGEEIKEQLWAWAWPKIQRSVFRGLPEWYKERLLEQQPVEASSARSSKPKARPCATAHTSRPATSPTPAPSPQAPPGT